MLRVLCLAALAGGCSPALAHDTWSNGKPLPAWIKKACCGPNDVHMLEEDQVHRVAGGYRVDGFRSVIPDGDALPSEDAHYWAFYYDLADGTQSRMFCFFVPMGS